MLVIIQIPTAEQTDRVAYAPEVGQAIERQFGRETIAALASIGFKFDAGL